MKTSPLFAAVVACIAQCGCSPSGLVSTEGWLFDYNAALQQAAKENKMVLLDFTGSDWCGPCIKLQKETFSKPDFKGFAAKNLVLVEVDFPRKNEQSESLKKQNQELAQKFGIEGLPTLILLDPQGKETARNVGYLPGGPEAFAKWVESAQKR